MTITIDQIRTTGLAIITIVALAVTGCSYQINYGLNQRDIVRAKAPQKMRVAVVAIADQRDEAERLKNARKQRGDADAGDYTYDKDFRGNVSIEISKMLAKHLQYGQCFESVEFVAADLKKPSLTEYSHLRELGYDAVLTGSLRSFYGYYDRNSGREFLLTTAIPGSVALISGFMSVKTEEKSMGGMFPMTYTETKVDPVMPVVATSLTSIVCNYVESSSSRDVAWQTSLSMNLTDLTTGNSLWSDSVSVKDKVHTSMPGLKTSKRKHEVAVASLREAVNLLTERLSQSPLGGNDSGFVGLRKTEPKESEQ